MRLSVLSFLFLALLGCSSTGGSKAPVTALAVAPTSQTPPVYQVSQEKYQSSLKEIKALIQKLNMIIRDQDYQTWVSYLDQAYIQSYSDPAYLSKLSEKPILKKNNIRILTLEDYFTYVVVPSRSNSEEVDDITFIDENRVEAWMMIKNQKALLYQLKLYGKEWKISYW
jgi:hypothetical protein